MSARAADERPTAVDFATHNVWGDELSAGEREECIGTLRELVQAFGVRSVLDAVTEIAGKASAEEANGSEVVLSALRKMCLLVIESDRPRLTATLVGRLVKLDLAANGRAVSLRQLGRANGISKQAVGNREKLYAERLQLPRLQSTPRSREAARLMNRRNYGGRG